MRWHIDPDHNPEDTAGEFVGAVRSRDSPFSVSPSLPKFRPVGRPREFASSIPEVLAREGIGPLGLDCLADERGPVSQIPGVRATYEPLISRRVRETRIGQSGQPACCRSSKPIKRPLGGTHWPTGKRTRRSILDFLPTNRSTDGQSRRVLPPSSRRSGDNREDGANPSRGRRCNRPGPRTT